MKFATIVNRQIEDTRQTLSQNLSYSTGGKKQLEVLETLVESKTGESLDTEKKTATERFDQALKTLSQHRRKEDKEEDREGSE